MRSVDLAYWTFNNGVSIHDELENVELSKIREVCDQQSRSKWTSIASRNRLYQFMALSDEETQQEMRLKALSILDMKSTLGTIQSGSTVACSSRNLSVMNAAVNEDEATSRASTSKVQSIKRYTV